MNEMASRILEYLMEMRGDIAEIKVDLREHKEGVIQNRARIEFLERREEDLQHDVEDLKKPSDANITFKTLKSWGQWIITAAAASKILYDIFS